MSNAASSAMRRLVLGRPICYQLQLNCALRLNAKLAFSFDALDY